MRACSGTWIAHGSGSADRERRRRARPGPACLRAQTTTCLRRVWLTAEEEQGYYYGFANEGLWPLCHVAHVRPVFRESDWEAYREVNQRFADAVVAEARSEDPIVLVQDYHFALLPAMIRATLAARRPSSTFWHIPWPNPESFGICPWRARAARGPARQHHPRLSHALPLQELPRDRRPLPRGAHRARALDDLVPRLGDAGRELSDLDRMADAADEATLAVGRAVPRRVFARHRACPPASGSRVGVDRFDYTKGILERLHAVERHAREVPAVDRQLHLRAGRRADAQLARGVPLVPGAHRGRLPSASTNASAATGYPAGACCARSTTSTTRWSRSTAPPTPAS